MSILSRIPYALKPKPPVLSGGSTWYKGTTAKGTLTAIRMVDSYTPTGSETESWAADENRTGSITCYVNGTELIIAGNGTGKIMANSNSFQAFRSIFKATKIIGLELLDTSKVTSMVQMFYDCEALTSLDASHFDTSRVASMNSMFALCKNLAILDLNGFDVSYGPDMSNMFSNCFAKGFTIYVSTQEMRTLVMATSNFPSTATVVVGKPPAAG